MVRTRSGTARALSRDAILDVAEQLIRTKGYERMSIQDVQDALGVSRGAIYHYFRSKAALLEAEVERMVDAIMAILAPIADDPDLPATVKLQGVFTAAGTWKAERKDLMVAILEAWYSDHNAIVREHVRRAASMRLAPLLAEVVRQGKAEGVFTAGSAEHSRGRPRGSPGDLGRYDEPALPRSPGWPRPIRRRGARGGCLRRGRGAHPRSPYWLIPHDRRTITAFLVRVAEEDPWSLSSSSRS